MASEAARQPAQPKNDDDFDDVGTDDEQDDSGTDDVGTDEEGDDPGTDDEPDDPGTDEEAIDKFKSECMSIEIIGIKKIGETLHGDVTLKFDDYTRKVQIDQKEDDNDPARSLNINQSNESVEVFYSAKHSEFFRTKGWSMDAKVKIEGVEYSLSEAEMLKRGPGKHEIEIRPDLWVTINVSEEKSFKEKLMTFWKKQRKNDSVTSYDEVDKQDFMTPTNKICASVISEDSSTHDDSHGAEIPKDLPNYGTLDDPKHHVYEEPKLSEYAQFDPERHGVLVYEWFNEREMKENDNIPLQEPKFEDVYFVQLKDVKLLAVGNYGYAFIASSGDGGARVVIKAPKSAPTDDDIKELELMKKLPGHPNVVPLIGVCNDFVNPVTKDVFTSIMLPHMKHGNLGNYIKDARLNDSLTDEMLINFALGMARGILFLHSQNILHRDIALRNVLVDEKGRVVVSDFGMSRKIYSEYYISSGKAVPWRWSAPETLKHKKSSTRSDCWMFGITILEMFKDPFPHSTIIMHYENVKTVDFRLEIPGECPKILARIAQKCCLAEPRSRITMDSVIETLKRGHG